jgi:hypothetical protein
MGYRRPKRSSLPSHAAFNLKQRDGTRRQRSLARPRNARLDGPAGVLENNRKRTPLMPRQTVNGKRTLAGLGAFRFCGLFHSRQYGQRSGRRS